MALPFGKPPPAANPSPAPFTISIPDDKISELKVLIKVSKIGPKTYENQLEDRPYGITREWLSHAKEKWEKEFDWCVISNLRSLMLE
jgi:microsomal epoxide hydrolase